jgi:hypothetical protein
MLWFDIGKKNAFFIVLLIFKNNVTVAGPMLAQTKTTLQLLLALQFLWEFK